MYILDGKKYNKNLYAITELINRSGNIAIIEKEKVLKIFFNEICILNFL